MAKVCAACKTVEYSDESPQCGACGCPFGEKPQRHGTWKDAILPYLLYAVFLGAAIALLAIFFRR